jgi:GT2 family glycosyltransferase
MIEKQYSWAKWVEGPKCGPAANRNNGAKFSRSEWLAFVDDDCLPSNHWLKAIWTNAFAEAVDVIEGKTVTPDKVDSPFRQGVENLTGGYYWSCNLAVRREVFFEIGAFDEDFPEAAGEDMEFSFRIRKNNLRVRFNENALVLHPTRSVDWKQLLYRTFFLIRWIPLYRIKVGDAPPIGASRLEIVVHLFRTEVAGLLRSTFHLVSKPDFEMWRTRLFFQVWNWLSFPIVFSYLLKWELRLRKQMLQDRKLSLRTL